ncbi:SAVED domain-containing protein [Azospirillum sp. TSO5]|uniref:SAVED domain-containing protein n=1 Tax=Azospirillum sp. TSO5 TaxID=716760 RepID=UPI000D604EBB|nr:SAVED domain-containing protein [Azospirillum sp. TSO5]PWC93024.1 hypothetical protein TSO5_16565 [Azospirillum sp. TSO5]
MAILHKAFDLIDHAARRTMDFVFRRRSAAMATFRAGISLVALSAAGALVASFLLKSETFTLEVHWEASGGVPAAIAYATFTVGLVLAIFGLAWEFTRTRAEDRANARRRVVVIEQRGLLPGTDSPLVGSVPSDLIGQRHSILIDQTPYIRDGTVTDPAGALARVVTIRHDLERITSDMHRSDVAILYGGVSPIPLTFLAGFLLDDEGSIRVMDWHRSSGSWHALDGGDDGDRFVLEGTDGVLHGAADVAVAVEVSYSVDQAGIRAALGNLPLVRLHVTQINPNGHWSDAKQQALAEGFLWAMAKLADIRARRIHLFIAAPNSVVFRLGRAYDRRNLPDALVYQYERSRMPAYPWAVRLPTHGTPMASIEKAVQATT